MVLGMTVNTDKHDNVEKVVPFFNNLQYDGRNLDNAVASLNVKLHQFVNVFQMSSRKFQRKCLQVSVKIDYAFRRKCLQIPVMNF